MQDELRSLMQSVQDCISKLYEMDHQIRVLELRDRVREDQFKEIKRQNEHKNK